MKYLGTIGLLAASCGIVAAIVYWPKVISVVTTASNKVVGRKGPIVPRGTMVSGFGSRGGTFHYGIDIGATTGTQVLCPIDGVVASAYPNGQISGFGNVVTILHGTVGTLYGHLDSIAVRVGQRITAGELIGTVGSTNSESGGFHTSGPHLHMEVIVPTAGTNAMHALAHYTGSTPPRIDPVQWAITENISIT